MVEAITGQDRRRVKVIYLTNKQAAHLAEDSTAMGRMITTLCGGTKRYLVIDLVQSWGFYNSTKIVDEKIYKNTKEVSIMPFLRATASSTINLMS